MDHRYFDAMALIEAISEELATGVYIWGGWTLDIHTRCILRDHADLDCFVVDLSLCFGEFSHRLLERGWQVKNMLDGNLLSAKKDGVKLHLGHVEIDDQIVTWKHNGNRGSILFPVAWLREEPIDLMNILVHVVEPELEYVLKTNPRLMNPAWELRDKDQADIAILEKILAAKNVDLAALSSRVSSI